MECTTGNMREVCDMVVKMHLDHVFDKELDLLGVIKIVIELLDIEAEQK